MDTQFAHFPAGARDRLLNGRGLYFLAARNLPVLPKSQTNAAALPPVPFSNVTCPPYTRSRKSFSPRGSRYLVPPRPVATITNQSPRFSIATFLIGLNL